MIYDFFVTETRRYAISYTHYRQKSVKYWCFSTKHWFFSPSFDNVVLLKQRKTAEKLLRDKIKHEGDDSYPGEVELHFGDGNTLFVPFFAENLKLEEIRLAPLED